MRKMSGLALGTVIVLGMNNALGSLLPLVLFHREQLISRTGLTLITGVTLMVAGVALCSWAGSIKKEVLAEEAGNLSSTDSKMRVRKGVLLAILSGAFGTMFNFAVVYGDRLRSLAERAGARPVNANNVVWCVSLMGGFIVNSAYCGYLLTRNRNWLLITARSSVRNSILSIVMGGTWMGGVAIYGMTVSKLERFGPSIGWALIQSEAIMAGNAMGLITGERRNTTNRFRCRMIQVSLPCSAASRLLLFPHLGEQASLGRQRGLMQPEQSRTSEVRDRSVTEREELSGSSLWLCFSRALAVSVKKFPR